MTQEKIRVFGTPSCPYCVILKSYLEEKNIEFEYIDVSQDKKAADEMIEKSGQMGVPVTEIGNEIIIGFDKVKINKLLNL